MTRVPIPPSDAERRNTVCQFCIVGCGYRVFKWPEGREGGPAPADNALGLDLREPLPPGSEWIAPAMHRVITESDGRRYHVAIVPDSGCSVNEGLSSVRGAGLAQTLYAPDQETSARLHVPMLLGPQGHERTSWNDAVDLGARIVKAVIDRWGPDAVGMKFFDHGGGGRRLREQLGDRAAVLLGHRDPDRVHPQPTRLQQRGARGGRCGPGAVDQRLPRRPPRGHHRRRRGQPVRDPDQLLPHAHDAQSPGCDPGEQAIRVRRRAGGTRPHDHHRSAAHHDRGDCRGGRRQGPGAAPRHRAGHRHRAAQRHLPGHPGPALARRRLPAPSLRVADLRVLPALHPAGRSADRRGSRFGGPNLRHLTGTDPPRGTDGSRNRRRAATVAAPSCTTRRG